VQVISREVSSLMPQLSDWPTRGGLLTTLGWAAATLLAIVFFAEGVPVLVGQIQVPCSGPSWAISARKTGH
jgi:uncharacterized membrane protein YccF (DUF307 family)